MKKLDDVTEKDAKHLILTGDTQEQIIVEKGGISFRKVELMPDGKLKPGSMISFNISNIDNPNEFQP